MTKPPFSRDDSITADARRWDPNRAARFTDAAAGNDAGRDSSQRSNPPAESLAACLSDVSLREGNTTAARNNPLKDSRF